jgi:methylated-DNA-[protein]-cysteine S-methyltransferase
MTIYCEVQSPLGPMRLVANTQGLSGIFFIGQRWDVPAQPDWEKLDNLTDPKAQFLLLADQQLKEYWQGDRVEFTLPLAPTGTEFQQSVWSQISTVKYGRFLTYGEIAHRLGNPKASRAVGAATGKNPLSIVVPCHRILGGNQQLTGYAGGLDRKQYLIDLETQGAFN